eukprot:1942365-Rhodomonas_salina.1
MNLAAPPHPFPALTLFVVPNSGGSSLSFRKKLRYLHPPDRIDTLAPGFQSVPLAFPIHGPV